ncbi:MAG: signal peptidase I [Eggerthellales bacterium]|nr:signal peptidase I [Eggerthellales bacterium]
MSYGDHAIQEDRVTVKTVVSGIAYVAFVVIAVWVIKSFIISPYTIPSSSMSDTISIGDNVWSERITYYFSDPKPGDIVTFDDPLNPSRTLIKRVVAVGGQTVDLIDGKVMVDGVALDEPYTDGKASYPETPAAGVSISYPYTIPDGEIWVMGDNRTNSADSRYFGSIDASSVSGRAIAIYWPIDHIGAL